MRNWPRSRVNFGICLSLTSEYDDNVNKYSAISVPLPRQSKGATYAAVLHCYQSDTFDKCEIYRYFRNERDSSPNSVTYTIIGCV